MEFDPAAFTRAVMAIVRELRKQHRITVDELVSRGEFNRTTLHRYLYEDREVPISALYRMSMALGVEPAEIVALATARLARDQDEINSPPTDPTRSR